MLTSDCWLSQGDCSDRGDQLVYFKVNAGKRQRSATVRVGNDGVACPKASSPTRSIIQAPAREAESSRAAAAVEDQKRQPLMEGDVGGRRQRRYQGNGAAACKGAHRDTDLVVSARGNHRRCHAQPGPRFFCRPTQNQLASLFMGANGSGGC